MNMKMNQSTVKQHLCISNVSDILQLVEQELLTLPEHMSSSSIVLYGLCCLIFSFLCSVCSSLFALLCFAFLSLFLSEQYCLSFHLRLTFELLNAYNFETCFVTLYDCTLRRVCVTHVSWVFCVNLKRLVHLRCIVWFEPRLLQYFGDFQFSCLCSSVLWNLEMSCVPLIFYGIKKCLVFLQYFVGY